ncbi:MAG: hypothetical protein QG580_399 [Patescibacteria group bacterium]|jgi:hypothetical protein|nr:hypothetical protein [Patescibacteria group bacterium]
MNFLRKIFLSLSLFIFPSVVFAGPSIMWENTPTIDQGVITGYLNISGIDSQTPPLTVLIFSDSDPEFNPYTSYANLSLAQNGPLTFQAPADGVLTYFLPVLVDGSLLNGQQLNPFASYTVGQVANISPANNNNGGFGGNQGGNPTGGGNQNPNSTNPNPTDNNNPQTSSGWPNEAIDNPLEVDNLNNFIANVLNAFLKIAIPILALFLIYSGLKFVIARGNEKELETAKQNLLWTVVGGTILLGAWTIVKILKGTVEELDITLINSLVNYFV